MLPELQTIFLTCLLGTPEDKGAFKRFRKTALEKERRARDPEKQREQDRLRRLANPEKGRAAARKYKRAHRELVALEKRERYWKDPEKARKADRALYWKDPEKARKRVTDKYWEDPEKARENGRRKYWANPEAPRKAARKQYHDNPEKALERDRERRKLKPELLREQRRARRPQAREYEKQQYHENLQYKLVQNLRSRIRSALKAAGVPKNTRTSALLGCSVEALKAYLGSLFRPGMTWENHGPIWHVDHIKPCAKFDLTDPEQQKRCFHWTNLQPLFAEENLKKGDTYVVQ